MGLSPVLDAYLRGYQEKTSALQTAHEVIQRQNELKQRQAEQADLMSRFQAENEISKKNLELQQQIHKLQHDKAIFDVEQSIREGLRSGAIPKPPDENIIPGLTEFGPKLPGMYRFQNPITGEMDSVAAPQTESESAISQAKAMLPILQQQTENTEAIKAKYSMAEWEKRLNNAQEIQSMKNDYQNYAAELRSKTAEEVATIRAQQAVNQMMMNMGLGGVTDVKGLITQHAHDRAMGIEDPSSTKGTAMNNVIENTMKNMGLVDLEGGSKTRAAIFNLGTTGADLLNKFDDLDKNYPASPNMAGRFLQWGRKVVPIGDEHTKYNEFESNLMQYAKTTAGITSSRLLDSNKEQSRFMGSLPKPTDSPQARADKKLNLVDNIFNHIQGSISGLSELQRKNFWADILKENENFLQLGEDPTFREKVIKPILQTGNYQPTYLNSMKMAARK